MPALFILLSLSRALSPPGAAGRLLAPLRKDEHPWLAHHQTAGVDDRPSLLPHHQVLKWRAYVLVSPPEHPCPIQESVRLAPERASIVGPSHGGTAGNPADTCGRLAEH